MIFVYNPYYTTIKNHSTAVFPKENTGINILKSVIALIEIHLFKQTQRVIWHMYSGLQLPMYVNNNNKS